MTDPPKLLAALRLLGRDPYLRGRLVDFLKASEPEIQYAGSVRDDIIGPIVDALHEETDVYSKRLADGTEFRYLYRTKIARDLLMAAAIEPTHVWEPQTTKLLLHFADSIDGDIIVGGAYFGDQAILVARRVLSRGLRVHCFEPNPAQAGMLRENIRLNRLPNMTVHEMGLWQRSNARMRLEGFDSFATAVLVADDSGFPTMAIDDFAGRLDHRIGLIQLDIEGGEHAALLGAPKVLSQFRPVIVFELHGTYVDWSVGLRNTPICSMLLMLGYQVFAIRDFNSHREMPNHRIELVDIDHVYLEGPPHGFNMLGFPPQIPLDSGVFRVLENVSPKLLPHKDPSLHHPVEGF